MIATTFTNNLYSGTFSESDFSGMYKEDGLGAKEHNLKNVLSGKQF